MVIDFTTPHAVLANIEAVVGSGKPMAVGTTGWYGEMKRVCALVEKAGTGFVFGANFSYGVNLFFDILKAAAPALAHGYSGHITERHHIHKKDAPSGTAVAMQKILQSDDVRITSEREGDVTGTHILELTSAGDRIVLTHEAKSRRTFAEGAVQAAEWIVGKTGCYDFKDVFGEVAVRRQRRAGIRFQVSGFRKATSFQPPAPSQRPAGFVILKRRMKDLLLASSPCGFAPICVTPKSQIHLRCFGASAVLGLSQRSNPDRLRAADFANPQLVTSTAVARGIRSKHHERFLRFHGCRPRCRH